MNMLNRRGIIASYKGWVFDDSYIIFVNVVASNTTKQRACMSGEGGSYRLHYSAFFATEACQILWKYTSNFFTAKKDSLLFPGIVTNTYSLSISINGCGGNYMYSQCC